MSEIRDFYEKDPKNHPLVEDLVKFTSKEGQISEQLARQCSQNVFDDLVEEINADYLEVQRQPYNYRWEASDVIIDKFKGCIDPVIPSAKKNRKVRDFAYATYKTLLRV